MGDSEESELRADLEEADDVDRTAYELELVAAEGSVLRVLLELPELKDIEVAD